MIVEPLHQLPLPSPRPQLRPKNRPVTPILGFVMNADLWCLVLVDPPAPGEDDWPSFEVTKPIAKIGPTAWLISRFGFEC